MTSFPNSPKVLRGAIVSTDPHKALASSVVFQYNPEKMTRDLTPHYIEAKEGLKSAPRLESPPKETISITVDIDATDQLEKGAFPATLLGVHPALAALEMLLYPPSAFVLTNEALSLAGMLEIIPPQARLTLLVWGVKRVVPVRLTSLKVQETHYDTRLNPIMATVTIDMDVLSYQDLGLKNMGGSLFMAHQVMKEVMAVIGSVSGSVSAATG